MRKFPIVLFLALLAAAAWRLIVLVTSLIPRMIPPAMVNIPNRDYWLSPERAEESLSFISLQGVWIGCILLVFLAGIDELIVAANSALPPVLPTAGFVAALVLLAAAIALWAVRMLRRFRRSDGKRGA